MFARSALGLGEGDLQEAPGLRLFGLGELVPVKVVKFEWKSVHVRDLCEDELGDGCCGGLQPIADGS